MTKYMKPALRLLGGAESVGRVVVRAAELERSGIPRSTIYHRCQPGGPWRRLLPGIIQLDPVEPGPDERLAAARLRAGPDAVVTGLSAARLHGLRRTPEPEFVHMLVPDRCHVTTSGFAVIERTTRMPNPHVTNGVRLAPVNRAVLDGARRLRDFDAIQAMLAEAIQRRRCTPESLRQELDKGSQRGSALVRRALVELLGGAHSVAEADARRLWRRARLPACEWNVPVLAADGSYVATPDAWADDVAMAWEIDSREFHHGLAGYAATLRRNARYAAAGIVVLQTLPSRIRKDPGAVVAELRAAYAAAQRRPRPTVRTMAA